jgi:hypothetical protein
VRVKDRRLLSAAVVLAGAAVAAVVVFGGGGAGAAPGKGKAVGATAHGAPASGSVGGGNASGDTSSPQPPSNGDFSGHGANVHGPYDSTRDGSASGNGNGIGKAIGKPCAGCVGKADNKNPPGQMPDGSDPNAGYECDRNHGIGRTNPAHTGCTSSSGTTTPPPPCEENCGGETSSPPPPPCEENCGGGGSGETPSAPASSSAPASPAAAETSAPPTPSSGLANTGAINAGLFAGIAGVLVVLGVAALTLSGWLIRRRTE